VADDDGESAARAHSRCPGALRAALALAGRARAGLGRLILSLLLIAVCTLALVPAIGAAQDAADAAAPVVLAGDKVPLSGHLETLYDPSGSMTWQEVAEAARAGGFQPIPGNFNAGYTKTGAWWLRFSVVAAPNDPGGWWLSIPAPFTDVIDIFHLRRAGGGWEVVHRRTGAAFPLTSRDLLAPTYVHQMAFRAGEEHTVLLRLEGRRSLSARPVLWRLPALVESLSSSVAAFSVGAGAAMFAALGALIFGLSLRNRAFLWYAAYVATTALLFLGHNGLTPIIFNFLTPASLLRLQEVIGCLSIMTAAFVVRSIFPVPRRFWVIRTFVLGLGLVAGIAVPLSALGFYGLMAPFLMVGVLLLALVVPFVAIRAILRGQPSAVWYFIGFVSYSAATFWFALGTLGLVPISDFTAWNYQAIAGLHMGAIFCGLASAMRAGAKERRQLQAELMQALRENARALEIQVAQRTAALEEEVAARRTAEAALILALREQRHFLVVVSHEFRTPLATISAAVGTIRQVAPLNADLDRESAKISRSVGRLVSLIDTFLAEAMLDRSGSRLQEERLDLVALVRDLAREHRAPGGREIHLTLPPATWLVADALLLRAAVDNLIGNALKYSDHDVHVTLVAHDDEIILQVLDRGDGIDPDEQEKIFERYYRSAAVLTRPGAGVGLSIVKQAVELHGGSVRVVSRPGQGSTFEVRLPRNTTGNETQPLDD